MTGSTDLRGAAHGAILPLVSLLLFCMALLTLWTARAHTEALRYTSQELRARALFAAADSGLETALAEAAIRLADAPPDFDATGRFRVPGPGGDSADGVRYRTFIHNQGLTPFSARTIELEAHGEDDTGGARRLRQQARLRPWLATVPPAPLIGHRQADFAGGLTLRNAHGDVLAWCGGLFNAPGAILEAAAVARCPPLGICAPDAALGALNADAAFDYWFARDRAMLRALATRHAAVTWLEADSGGGAPLVIEGSVGYGSEDSPGLLIVAGDLEVRGALSVDGLLYIDGDWLAGSGSVHVRGAAITAGAAAHQGELAIEYRPAALQTLAEQGDYVRIPGSWIDF
jgi:hypothetical protein